MRESGRQRRNAVFNHGRDGEAGGDLVQLLDDPVGEARALAVRERMIVKGGPGAGGIRGCSPGPPGIPAGYALIGKTGVGSSTSASGPSLGSMSA